MLFKDSALLFFPLLIEMRKVIAQPKTSRSVSSLGPA